MYMIDGFVTLGEIDFSEQDADIITLLLTDSENTGLYRLDSSGCSCCGDCYDYLTPDNVTPVTATLLELAKELYADCMELDDAEQRVEAEGSIREALGKISQLFPG